MARWLVTGASGLLGAACTRALAASGHDVTAHHLTLPPLALGDRVTWRPLDLRDAAAARRLVTELAPDVVIHTAALAQPRECELDRALAEAVNVRATAALADAARECGARFLHVSTDLVFAGDKAPYAESDPRTPIHVYGRTKAQAEDEVARRCRDSVIVRTSLQVGPSPRGTRGIEEILAATLRRGERPALFTDEYRCPMAADDLAGLLLWMGNGTFTGVVHACGTERLSRYEIGVQVAEAFGFPVEQLDALTLKAAPQAFPPRAPDVTLSMDRLRSLRPPRMPRTLREVLTAHPLARR